MDFAKFQYVVSVAELSSFSKAAEKCHISQPALSKCINKIEDELGVKLFDRSRTPIRLTYAGERYIESMKNILAMKFQLDKEIEDITNLKRGRLAVGIPDSRSADWLSQILPPYLNSYPGIDVKVFEDTSSVLEQAILKENIDLSVVGTLPILLPGIEYETIAEEQLMIVMPSNHSIFKSKVPPDVPNLLHYLNPQRLQGQPYVSVMPEQGLYRAAKQIFDRYGLRPKTVLEISNTSTAFYLASGGLGFTIAPVRSIASEKYLRKPVYCTVDDPPFQRTIIVSYKKDRLLSTAARQFIDVTKRVVSTIPMLQVPKFQVLHDIDD